MATTNKEVEPFSAEFFGDQITRSKDFPWYHRTLGDRLSPECREILLKYSKLPEEKLEQHVLEARDAAWQVCPFPCVGGFWFLQMGLSLHPRYPRLLARLQAQPASKLLDVGTCVSQDLRKLTFDGASPTQLYGTDVLAGYEPVAAQLWNDEANFKGHFIASSILSDESPLMDTKGTWDIQTATMFLHCFDLLNVKKAVSQLLKLSKGPGSWLMGGNTGSLNPGEQNLSPPFVQEGEYRPVYRASKETFKEIWEEVAAELGMKISVWADYEESYVKALKGETKYFEGDQQRIWWMVEVL